jgi:cytochrome P450
MTTDIETCSIIAGSDTTSTALTSALFYLVRNVSALQKAAEEVRSKFGDVEEICQGPVLNSCTYLRACIDEGMRMSPPVGGILPREVLPGGITIDGDFIPEGCIVATPHYTIHHNANYFPDPFTYRPERWVAGSGKTSGGVAESNVALAQSAFCPFSIGPRGCIGKGLAYIELMTTLARMLYLYDMRKTSGVDPSDGKPSNPWGRHRVGEYQLYDQFTSWKNGPIVEFRKR